MMANKQVRAICGLLAKVARKADYFGWFLALPLTARLCTAPAPKKNASPW